MLLAVALSGVHGAALASAEQASAANSVNQAVESAGLQNASASAQDLSLFGVLALGIIGLLWVRRHTSEL
jgi:hypothetical protein